jgi:pimeloyl-ACP methyl ester carboxylesterase
MRIGGEAPGRRVHSARRWIWAPCAGDGAFLKRTCRAAWASPPHPDTGYTKKNQAAEIAGMLLKIEKADLVTHDIGNMVGYAFAAQFPARVTRWVVIDALLPGIGPWEDIIRSPLLWHFNFHGPDEERLVQGRERIYLDRFRNEFSANPAAIDEATRRHYAELCCANPAQRLCGPWRARPRAVPALHRPRLLRAHPRREPSPSWRPTGTFMPLASRSPCHADGFLGVKIQRGVTGRSFSNRWQT